MLWLPLPFLDCDWFCLRCVFLFVFFSSKQSVTFFFVMKFKLKFKPSAGKYKRRGKFGRSFKKSRRSFVKLAKRVVNSSLEKKDVQYQQTDRTVYHRDLLFIQSLAGISKGTSGSQRTGTEVFVTGIKFSFQFVRTSFPADVKFRVLAFWAPPTKYFNPEDNNTISSWSSDWNANGYEKRTRLLKNEGKGNETLDVFSMKPFMLCNKVYKFGPPVTYWNTTAAAPAYVLQTNTRSVYLPINKRVKWQTVDETILQRGLFICVYTYGNGGSDPSPISYGTELGQIKSATSLYFRDV